MTETAQTFKDCVDTIMPYLQQVADNLGTTAEYLWKLQVKQAYVEGIGCLLGILACLAFYYVLYRFWKWMFQEGEYENYNGDVVKKKNIDGLEGASVFAFFISFGVGIICTLYIYDHVHLMLTLLINPEYWALNQVILLVKGSIHF